MKKSTLLLIILLALSAAFALFPEKIIRYTSSKLACSKDNQFLTDTKGVPTPPEGNVISPARTVEYFNVNFDSYKDDSKIIEEFDDLDKLELKGAFTDEKLSNDS